MAGPGRGAIIAAGEGSRLRADGFRMPKPLVEVAGEPLIGGVLRNFAASGITAVTIILNEEERECVEWVRARFPGLEIDFIVKTTASSLESFREVTGRGPAGPLLVSTVDAWCAAEDFARFAAAAARRPDDATVLAVTPLVSDEKPLWVTLGTDGRVAAIGEADSGLVTAGVYRVSDRARRLAAGARLGRLREYLGWLLERGEPLYGEVIETVVDVDRGLDVASAEALARGARRA
ncbi:MAG TPA: NTP transferase domain-containing protein [Methylomirabilota bacterium]|nr:NTP transferase domain-containing protein [Methylomirabilota bacterium]